MAVADGVRRMRGTRDIAGAELGQSARERRRVGRKPQGLVLLGLRRRQLAAGDEWRTVGTAEIDERSRAMPDKGAWPLRGVERGDQRARFEVARQIPQGTTARRIIDRG